MVVLYKIKALIEHFTAESKLYYMESKSTRLSYRKRTLLPDIPYLPINSRDVLLIIIKETIT